MRYDLCSRVQIGFALVEERPMDPLSGVLALLKPRDSMFGGFAKRVGDGTNRHHSASSRWGNFSGGMK